MAKSLLKISLTDLELLDNNKQEKDNIVCILFLNGSCVDKLYFKYKDYQSVLPLTHSSEKVQLIFQAKDSGDLIGCISFSASNFLSLKGKSFTQW